MDTENVFYAITSKVPFSNVVSLPEPEPSPISKPVVVKSTVPASSIPKTTTHGVKKPIHVVTKKPVSLHRVPLAPRPTTAPPVLQHKKNIPQVAKHLSMHMKIDRVADMKDKWAKDKAMKKNMVEQRRADEIRFLHETALLEAELRRKMLNSKRETEFKKKSAEREVLQAFSTDRVHAVKETERMKKDRRKKSVLMNNEIVNQRRQKEAVMEQNKHDAEISILQSRREDFLKLTEARKAEEDRRRESMVGRGITAQQHKELKEQMEQAQHNNEVSLLQSRREDFLKLTEARKAEEDRRRESMIGRGITAQQHREVAEKMEQARHDETTDELHYRHYLREQKAESEKDEVRRSRESLAGRLNTWRAQRSIEEQQQNEAHEEERDLFDTRHANWQDTNAHKNNLEQKRRESLAFRLDEWRRHKIVADKEANETNEAEQMDWMLKQQAHEDVETYRQACNASRRESLAIRLEKARQDRSVEEALEQQKAILEAEEYRLKAEDHAAVAKYQADMETQRRQSLEFRNKMAHMERLRAEEEKLIQRSVEEAGRELSVGGWRDARDAEEANKVAARRELAEKVLEDRRRHEVDLQEQQKAFDTMQDTLQVRHSNWQDDQAEHEAEIARRRQSMSLRLEAWRRERMIDEMLKNQDQIMSEEDARLREQDWADLQAAKTALKMQERLNRLKGWM